MKDAEVAEREHFPRIDRQLRKLPPETDAVLDLSGVELISFTYAKVVLRPCFEAMYQGRYCLNSLTLAFDKRDYQTYLESVTLALAEMRITALLRLTGDHLLVPLGYLTYESPFETQRERRKKGKLLKILESIIIQGGMYTNAIALALNLTPQNCNYLLGELEAMHLIKRIKENSPSGGPLYLNRIAAR